MPLPLIPLGYAAAALLAAYGGKKVYDKVGQTKAGLVQDVKEAAGATRAALLAAGAAVLDAWATVSAFYVGLMAGFGIHFLRLIDKTSLFHELVFYATIISALRAPAALVAALAYDDIRGKTMEWSSPLVVATSVIVSFVLLDRFYAICFCIFAAVLLLLTWFRPRALGRAFYAVCALAFGYLYAETLMLQKPDTKLISTDSKSVRITLLMSTPRGLIGLDENRQMAQYVWSSIASVSVEPGPTKLDGLRELLKVGRAAFEGNVLRAFK